MLETLRDRAVEVPHTVAVMGFDNWDVLVSGARPPLTSVDMNFEALGRNAARRLLESIAGDEHSGVEQLDCRVVVRESTAFDG